jgi:hypothetical protein
MTYLVAFGQPALNTIIADTRVTWSSGAEVPDDPHTGLKVGLLFPGCIYGVTANDVSEAQKFIVRFRASIYRSTDTLPGLWRRFERFVELYEFPPPSQQFQLVLSHRAFGHPRFAVLDSESGLDQTVPSDSSYFATFGSGRGVLDPILIQELMPRFDEKHRKLLLQVAQIPEPLIPHFSPYFLCLWLNEKSLTFEASQLHEEGVGGLFHFVWQTAGSEGPQEPAVYIFCMVNRASNTVYSWVYRVVPFQEGVYIEEYKPATDRFIAKFIFNSATSEIVVPSGSEFERFLDRELAALPYFNFCGIGFIDPSERRGLCFDFRPFGKREDIFDGGDGRTLARNLRILIDQHFGLIQIFPPNESR